MKILENDWFSHYFFQAPPPKHGPGPFREPPAKAFINEGCCRKAAVYELLWVLAAAFWGGGRLCARVGCAKKVVRKLMIFKIFYVKWIIGWAGLGWAELG